MTIIYYDYYLFWTSIFNPPYLYCVTTLPSKTNTTANIGVKC